MASRRVGEWAIAGDTTASYIDTQTDRQTDRQTHLPIRDSHRVVVPVQPVDQRLDRRLVQTAQIRGGLPRLLAEHHRLRTDAPKRVDHDLTLHRLDRIDHHRHGPRVERLERLLRVDVHPRQPAPKPGMAMVPSDHHLGPPHLLQHIQHLGLEHRIDRLDGHARPGLRHRKHVDDLDGIVVHKLAQHEPHHLERHARPTVLQHLEQRERRNVDLLSGVLREKVEVRVW